PERRVLIISRNHHGPWFPSLQRRRGEPIFLSSYTARTKRKAHHYNLHVQIEEWSNEGVSYATGNDWTGKDGGKYGSAASQGRPSVHRLRYVAESCERVSPGEGGGKLLTA